MVNVKVDCCGLIQHNNEQMYSIYLLGNESFHFQGDKLCFVTYDPMVGCVELLPIFIYIK